MKKYFALLSKSTLFAGLSDEELEKICDCLGTRVKKVSRESFVFHAGDSVHSVYLILSGSMHIIDEDFWGNRSIIETMPEHTLFGEAYALSKAKTHLVSVVAAEDSMFIEMDSVRLFETCPKGCTCHVKIIKNTMLILSEKIVRLTEKLGHIVQRSTREKLLSYLSKCARESQKNSFYIPYSRQQLADYLCVERSALSHTLSKLREEGMVQYRKNYFELMGEIDQ